MLLPNNVCVSETDSNCVTSSSFHNDIDSCVVPELTPLNLHFKIQVNLKSQNWSASVVAMVDCSAIVLFISERFVKMNKVHTHSFVHKIPLYNINSLRNKVSSISHFVCLQLQIGKVEEWQEFLITELGPKDMVLGLPWLRSMNLAIDWTESTMKVRLKATNPIVKPSEGREVNQIAAHRTQWCQ